MVLLVGVLWPPGDGFLSGVAFPLFVVGATLADFFQVASAAPATSWLGLTGPFLTV